jgi:transposase-like protein
MTTLLRWDPTSRPRWYPFKDRDDLESQLATREATGNGEKEALAVAQCSNGMSCPHCSSADYQRSVRHGGRDFLRRLLGRFPWRCNGCRKRFYLRKRFLD